MRFVAGIDGGQSSTTAVVVDDGGRIVGWGMAGPADHVDEPPGSTRCADACAAAIASALDAAGLSRATAFEAVCAGISGYDAAFDGAPLRVAAGSVRLEHDAPIALAGAVPGRRPAIVVIAGTGSVAYGEAGDGRAVRVGGWGYLFGDEGSAFAIARDALADAMIREDRGEPSALGDAALAFFDRRSLRETATHALQGRISRDALAAFARVVQDAARLGDPTATRMVDAAATAVAALAVRAIERLDLAGDAVAVAFSGGVFGNEAFFTNARARLAALAPLAAVVRPAYEPAVGAALMAFAQAGMEIPGAIVR